METPAWTIIPNDHPISECWHPHYHKSPFRNDLAEIFIRLHRKNYPEGHPCFLTSAAPLCIFGGVQYVPYIHSEASGTCAVCPSCREVTMCGYDDKEGLSPKSCPKCEASLELNHYFQPFSLGTGNIKGLVNPKRDVAITIAEACALIESESVGFRSLTEIVVILRSEKLFLTGDFVDDVFVHGRALMSGKVMNCVVGQMSDWFYLDTLKPFWNVRISDRGKMMLHARGIVSPEGARERALSLLHDARLSMLALKAFADQELAKTFV